MASPKAIHEQVLSGWHAIYLIDLSQASKRRDYYKRELEIDAVRQTSFSAKVSRLTGLYFFQDKDSARIAGRRWGVNFKEEYLTEIEVLEQSAVSIHDSEWITKYMNSPDKSWIPKYLQGEPCNESPVWGRLVDGGAFILGTRGRQRAYETVKRTWPRSLGLLELSRVAVEMDSDLGLIWPMLIREGNTFSLRLYLNFCDAKDTKFLEKLSKYSGPKNTADLNSSTNLVPPDLSEYFVEIPR